MARTDAVTADRTLDAPTLAAATMTLALVSAAAIAIPEMRASRIAPTEALRGE